MTRGKGGQGKIRCESCENLWYVRELKVRVDTEADESGVYVVRYYVCPNCLERINDKRLRPLYTYPAPSSDEPLRMED